MTEQYDICKGHFHEIQQDIKTIISSQAAITKEVREINNRLYKDNGVPSYQTRLLKLEQDYEGRKWLNRAAIGAAVVIGVKFVWEAVVTLGGAVK